MPASRADFLNPVSERAWDFNNITIRDKPKSADLGDGGTSGSFNQRGRKLQGEAVTLRLLRQFQTPMVPF